MILLFQKNLLQTTVHDLIEHHQPLKDFDWTWPFISNKIRICKIIYWSNLPSGSNLIYDHTESYIYPIYILLHNKNNAHSYNHYVYDYAYKKILNVSLRYPLTFIVGNQPQVMLEPTFNIPNPLHNPKRATQKHRENTFKWYSISCYCLCRC